MHGHVFLMLNSKQETQLNQMLCSLIMGTEFSMNSKNINGT